MQDIQVGWSRRARREDTHLLRRGVALALGLAHAACAPLAPPEQEAGEMREAVLHGAPANDGASQVLRVEVEQSEQAPLLLFSGSLSEYYERRIQERDLPESLLERQVPVLT